MGSPAYFLFADFLFLGPLGLDSERLITPFGK